MDKMDYAAIGKRIRYIRLEKGMTQAKMAEMAEISTNYVSRIELGNAKFSLAVLVGLCNALDVSTDYILSGVVKRESRRNKHMIGWGELSDTQIEFIEQIICLAGKYRIVK